MFSKDRTFMLLPQPRRLPGCDLDWECVAPNLLQLALIFTRQVLNEESYITGDNDMRQAAFTFVKAMKKLYLTFFMDA